MNNLFAKMLLIVGSLSFSNVVLADWKQDCQSLENANNACAPIEKQVQALSVYMTPIPFVSTTINQFPDGVFPGGSPWGSSGGSGGGGSGGGTTGALQNTGTGTSTGTETGTGTGTGFGTGGGGGTFQ